MRPQSAAASKQVRFDVKKDGSNTEVQFYSKGGRSTQNVQIYKDIDQLPGNMENGRSNYSMKQNRFEVDQEVQKQKQRKEMIDLYAGKKGHGQIEIAGVQLEQNDVAKLNSIIDGQYNI